MSSVPHPFLSSALPQPRDGEPVVTVLNAGPIRVKDGYFSRPRGSSDLLRAPSRFPVPQTRLVLKEISVVWHLYGGKDFGGKPALSLAHQHSQRYRDNCTCILNCKQQINIQTRARAQTKPRTCSTYWRTVSDAHTQIPL